MRSKEEQIKRLAGIESGLASQRMEGLEPDATVVEDAKRWARGEITKRPPLLRTKHVCGTK
jgi:hypothetical protein